MRELLARVADGTVSVDNALIALRRLPTVEDLGFARLDTHRGFRQGLPEAIYAEGKTTEEVLAIAQRLLDKTDAPVLATRCSPQIGAALEAGFPQARHLRRSGLVVLRAAEGSTLGRATVVSAGTSDLAVAEEAAGTAAAVGIAVTEIADVGVAGLHRLLEVQDQLHDTDVVIVVAGMEGALASLVGGIASAPVIAVPTSVGYGASFGGLAALLAMLNSCAAGVAVMNIDNGFGAACFAARLLAKRS